MKKCGFPIGVIFGLILFSLALLLSSAYLAGPPSEGTKVTEIGVLSVNAKRLEKIEGLKDGLKQCMLQEGTELHYTILEAGDDLERLPQLAEELVRENPGVLVAAGAPETRALQAATQKVNNNVPIVFMGTLSPAKIGLVEDVDKPTGNVTGLDNYHLDLTPKRLELLHRLLPEVRKIGVLGDNRIYSYTLIPKTLEKVAQKYSLELEVFSITEWGQVESVFQTMKRNHIEAVLLLPGFFLETTETQLVDEATLQGLPLFGVYPEDAEKGCLASYGTSYYCQGVQSAHLVHKILSGSPVQELPVETPDEVSFVVNLKSAEKLGLDPIQNVLSLADRIIKEN